MAALREKKEEDEPLETSIGYFLKFIGHERKYWPAWGGKKLK